MEERTITTGSQGSLHHPFYKRKGNRQHAIITTESPYFHFRTRSNPESLWIIFTTISNMDSYQRVNAASIRNVGLLRWCLLQDINKRSVRNRILTSIYVDLTKTSDMVNRDGLWRIMAKYVKQFHSGMHARVQDKRESSVAFPVKNGIKQGCAQTLTLFSIMFSMMHLVALNRHSILH